MSKDRADLTNCAFKIFFDDDSQGEYFEDTITGYNTLKVTGRKTLTKELTTYTSSKRDGLILNYTRYPDRDIIVSFVLGSDNLAESFELLAQKLDYDKVKVIFNDEPDKYIMGTPVLETDLEEYGLFGVGTFRIKCLDPFKYSTTETEVLPTTVINTGDESDAYDSSKSYEVGDICTKDTFLYTCTTATSGTWNPNCWQLQTGLAFTTNNTGGYTSYPRFEIQFQEAESEGAISTNADCGFVQLALNDYRLQFGDDEEEAKIKTTVFNTNFAKPASGSFSNAATGTTIPNTTYVDRAQATATKNYGFVPKYGTLANKWHGSYITANAAAATDFTFNWTQVFACNKTTATGKKQKGVFMAICLDSSNNIVAGVKYIKSSTAKLEGTVYYIVNNSNVKSKAVNFKYTGAFGYKKKTNGSYVAKKTKNTIKRVDNEIIFDLACDTSPVSVEVDSTVAIAKVGFFMGQYSSSNTFSYNWPKSAEFINGDGVDNTFVSGNLLEVDCGTADVRIDGKSNQSIGDVGNDWSNFYLDRGTNTIFIAWSDWVVSGYEPDCKMYYTKRWI